MSPKSYLLVSTAVAGCLFAGVASAQAPAAKPAAAPPAAAQENLIGEVIVTAEKREQNLQQVPVAISAFTAEKRDLLGITSVVDQTNYTPGLTYTATNDRLSLRGVGRLTNIQSADSGTAIYIDNVFITTVTQAGRSPLFIERTEILRGPQGTLYGRNAIGGAYNLISKHPSREFSGEARVGFGNYERYEVNATLSVPLTENLRTRFNFTHVYQGQGYENNLNKAAFDSEAGNRDEIYYEGQIEGEVGKFDFWLQYFKNIGHNSAPPGTVAGGSFAPSNTTLGTGALISPSYGFTRGINLVTTGPTLGNPVLTSGALNAEDRDTRFQNTLHGNNGFTTHLAYHFPAFDLKYVGGFLNYDYRYVADNDGTSIQSFQVPLNPTAAPIAVVPGLGAVNCYQLSLVGACKPFTAYFGGATTTYEEDAELYSHELTIASTWDSPLQYIAGIYYFKEKLQNPVAAYDPLQTQLNNPLSLTGGASPKNPVAGRFAYSNAYQNISSKAAYGQLDYKLTDAFKVTAGLRYTNDEKKVVEEERFIYIGSSALGSTSPDRFGSNLPAIDVTPSAIGALPAGTAGQTQQGVIGAVTFDANGLARRKLRDGSNAVTGTFGVEWTPDRKTLAYAKYSRGYKALGLFATQLPSAFSAFPYSKPEQMDNLEVGLKKDWTRRFQTNIVGFYDLYYNAQVPLSVQQGNNPAFTLFYNVPRSILQGVELESTWAATDHLTFLFTYAFLDAHVTKGCCVSDPVDPTATQPGAQPAGASSQGAIDAITGLPTRGQSLVGQQLPLSPRNKIAFNATYTFNLGKYGDLITSASYLWRDQQYSSFFNRSYNLIPSRDQIDLRATFRDAKNRFELVGYARNIGNSVDFERQSGTRSTTGQIYTTYDLTDPRTYGVELRGRF